MPDALSKQVEFAEWAASQPIRYGLVDGRLARLPEGEQVEARLALARKLVRRVFGSEGMADAWLARPSPELGGIPPADLVAVGDEGSRLTLLTLVRVHRRTLGITDG